MRNPRLLKLAGLLLAGTLGMQAARAQGTAVLNSNYLNGNQSGTNSSFVVKLAPDGVNGPYMQMYGNDNSYTAGAGAINFIAGYNANGTSFAHNFFLRSSNGAFVSNMRLLQSGQVQIGIQNPTSQTDYRLAVDGKVVAKSLYVTNPSMWADFVFGSTYKNMPLRELGTYLQRNKHLPAMPSANEVAANGYSVSEMDAKLLQSIEELTLHVIEMGKQNDLMQRKNAALQADVNGLKKKMSKAKSN